MDNSDCGRLAGDFFTYASALKELELEPGDGPLPGVLNNDGRRKREEAVALLDAKLDALLKRNDELNEEQSFTSAASYVDVSDEALKTTDADDLLKMCMKCKNDNEAFARDIVKQIDSNMKDFQDMLAAISQADTVISEQRGSIQILRRNLNAFITVHNDSIDIMSKKGDWRKIVKLDDFEGCDLIWETLYSNWK